MDFREAWRRVEGLEGEAFQTDRGEPFRYRFKKTYVVISPGELSIPRTNFEKVFKRDSAPEGEKAPAVQGQRYIRAILSDRRFDA